MKKYFGILMLGAFLTAPVASFAQEHRYYDKNHKDWHNWNDDENRSYHQYLQEKHIKEHDWAKAKKSEQNDYWRWRHDHPDHH